MSNAPTWCWSLPVSAATRLTLTVLWSFASRCDVDAVVWPSTLLLATRTGQTERAVRRQLGTLVEKGAIVRVTDGTAWKLAHKNTLGADVEMPAQADRAGTSTDSPVLAVSPEPDSPVRGKGPASPLYPIRINQQNSLSSNTVVTRTAAEIRTVESRERERNLQIETLRDRLRWVPGPKPPGRETPLGPLAPRHDRAVALLEAGHTVDSIVETARRTSEAITAGLVERKFWGPLLLTGWFEALRDREDGCGVDGRRGPAVPVVCSTVEQARAHAAANGGALPTGWRYSSRNGTPEQVTR